MKDLLPNGTKGPIFIVGCPRSGTSMLVRILQLHDNIKIICGESWFYETVYGNRLTFGKIKSDRGQKKLQEYVEERKSRKNEWKVLQFDDWIEKYINIDGENYLDLYKALMLTFADSYYSTSSGAYYIGDKNPSDIYHIEHLMKYFPNLKVIDVVRDGRAVVASLLKSGFGYKNLIEAILTWKSHVQISRRLKKKLSSNNYLRIPYEELVIKPENVLSIICDYLGITFQGKMIAANVSGLSSFDKVNDTSFDPTRIFQYKKVLSRDQINLVEYIVEGELRELGYLSKEYLATPKVSVQTRLKIWMHTRILTVKERVRKWSILMGILRNVSKIRWIFSTR